MFIKLSLIFESTNINNYILEDVFHFVRYFSLTSYLQTIYKTTNIVRLLKKISV